MIRRGLRRRRWLRVYVAGIIGIVVSVLAATRVQADEGDWLSSLDPAPVDISVNQAAAIVEDAQGLVWIASGRGLVLWDGIEEHHFLDGSNGVGPGVTGLVAAQGGGIWAAAGELVHVDPWNRTTDRTGQAAVLVAESKSDLWLWSPGKVKLFDPQQRTVLLELDVEEDQLDRGVVPIATDADGNLFLGTSWGMLIIDRSGTMERFTVPLGVSAVGRRAQGGVWAGSISGLWQVQAHLRPVLVQELPRERHNGEPVHPGRGLAELSDGAVWLGTTRSSVAVYQPDLEEWLPVGDFGVRRLGKVTAIMEDRNSGRWIAHDGAGVTFVGSEAPFLSSIGPRSVNTQLLTTGITRRGDTLWVGTEGDGVHRVDLQTEEWPDDGAIRFSTGGLGSGADIVLGLGQTREYVWAGTWGQGLHRISDDGEVLPVPLRDGSFIFDLVVDDEERLWVSTWGHGVQVLDATGRPIFRLGPQERLQTQNVRVRSVVPTPGMVFLGGDRGLEVVDLETGTTTRYGQDTGHLEGSVVHDVHVVDRDEIWLATAAGLERVTPATGEVVLFSHSNGVASGPPVQIVPHATDDALWLASETSLALFDLAAEQVVDVYGESDGLRSSNFRPVGHEQVDDGTIYLATADGLAVVPPTVHQSSEVTPTVFALCTAGCPDDGSENMSRDGSTVTFEFFGINYRRPHSLRYRYRLQGADEDWVNAGSARRSVSYSDLPQGNYLFQVEVIDDAGQTLAATGPVGSPGGPIVLRVTNRWWQEAQVRLLLGLAVAVVLMLWVAHRFQVGKRRSEKLEQLVQERTAALVESQEQTERASAAKTDFMRMVSHDLRSPLTSILGYAELIALGPDGSRVLQWSTSIAMAGRHLQGMIEDLLDTATLDDQVLEIEIGPVDVVEAIREVVALTGNDANTPGDAGAEQIGVNLDDDLSRLYQLDGRRLRQVLLNLTTNSVRYSNGGITISAQVVTQSHLDGHRLRFAVADAGPGFDPADTERLFAPFERGSSRAEGSGLGLSICAQVISAMGGEIGVNVRQGESCEFWFELTARPLAATKCPPPLNGDATVLIVDDENQVREFMADAMQELGFGTVLASSGTEAIDLASAEESVAPALVITDLVMPGMTGAELAEELQARPAFAGVPIVAMSALPNDALAAGCFDAVVAKPLTLLELERAIRNFWPAGATPH